MAYTWSSNSGEGKQYGEKSGDPVVLRVDIVWMMRGVKTVVSWLRCWQCGRIAGVRLKLGYAWSVVSPPADLDLNVQEPSIVSTLNCWRVLGLLLLYLLLDEQDELDHREVIYPACV